MTREVPQPPFSKESSNIGSREKKDVVRREPTIDTEQQKIEVGIFHLPDNRLKIGERLVDASQTARGRSARIGERRIKFVKALAELSLQQDKIPSRTLWEKAFMDEPYSSSALSTLREWANENITLDDQPIIHYVDRRRGSYYELPRHSVVFVHGAKKAEETASPVTETSPPRQETVFSGETREERRTRSDRGREQPTHEELVVDFLAGEAESRREEPVDPKLIKKYEKEIWGYVKKLSGLKPDCITIGQAQSRFRFLRNMKNVRGPWERGVIPNLIQDGRTVIFTREDLIRLAFDHNRREVTKADKRGFEIALKSVKQRLTEEENQ